MGSIGASSTGVHLHFAISHGFTADGRYNYLDPANYITLPKGLTMAWDVRYNSTTGRYENITK